MNSVQPSAAQGGDLDVVGHQWWWEIRYPGTNVVTANEIHLPVGRRMLVAVTSADVIHDLWLPQLGGKMDLVPGQINHMYLEADRPGSISGPAANIAAPSTPGCLSGPSRSHPPRSMPGCAGRSARQCP